MVKDRNFSIGLKILCAAAAFSAYSIFFFFFPIFFITVLPIIAMVNMMIFLVGIILEIRGLTEERTIKIVSDLSIAAGFIYFAGVVIFESLG